MTEIWKSIREFPDYEISNFGRVKSLSREISNGRGTIISKEIILKPSFDTDGYKRISMRKDGKSYTRKIHRLVAQYFLKADKGKSEVNHLDENKANNHVENLEWVNHLENVNYGTRTKRQSNKLMKPIIQYNLDGILIKMYRSTKEAAIDNNISPGCIWNCLSGNRKTAIGYIWKYETKGEPGNVNTSTEQTTYASLCS